MFPLEQLTSAVTAFQEKFPATPLTLYVEALGCRFAASDGGSLRLWGDGLSAHRARTAHTRTTGRREDAFCRVSEAPSGIAKRPDCGNGSCAPPATRADRPFRALAGERFRRLF